MIRVDYAGEPHAVLILTPRLLGWTAELRPLAGEPPLVDPRRWRLTKWAAATAVVHQLNALDPLRTFITRRLFRGLTAEIDAQVYGNGTAELRGIVQ